MCNIYKLRRFCKLISVLQWFHWITQNIPTYFSASAFKHLLKCTLCKHRNTVTSEDSSAPHMSHLQLFSRTTTADNIVNGLKVVQSALDAPSYNHPPTFLHNYPIKSALMSSLSPCPEASPHSVCKVRVPSLPQFDSVKAWKQIKGCCFSQSRWDTEPVRTRLTRGSFATCCFCLWWGLRNVGTSLYSWFCSLFSSLSLQWVTYEKDQGEH